MPSDRDSILAEIRVLSTSVESLRVRQEAETERRADFLERFHRSAEANNGRFDDVRRRLEDLEGELRKGISKEIEESVKAALKARILGAVKLFSGGSAVTILAVIAALWASPPLRHSVLDSINNRVQFDDFLAYKLNKNQPFKSEEKSEEKFSPLREAITKLDTMEARYVKQDSINSQVGLSLPFNFNLQAVDAEDYAEMTFYSDASDRPFIFCTFNFDTKETLPSRIRFEVDDEAQDVLSYTPRATKLSDEWQWREIKIGEDGKFGPGIHSLRVAVSPPSGFAGDAKSKGKSGARARGNCLIAVVGRTDAGRLLSARR